jgi:hypothetical protein
VGEQLSASGPALRDHFGLGERIAIWISFYGAIAVGTVGIWQVSPAWSVTYLLLVVLGLLGPIVYGLCSHCPYPHHLNQCLFLPPSLVRRLYSYRGPKMSPLDGLLFLVPFAAIFLAPLIWLYNQPVWLAAFVVLILPAAAAPAFYYCRRCRHVGCPVNRVRGGRRKEAWIAVTEIKAP